MEATYSPPNNSFDLLKWILIFGVVILMAVIISTAISHGYANHPETYNQVIKCINDGKYTLNFNAGNGRFIQFCMIDEKTVGMRVLDKLGKGQYKEITAYIKDTLHSLADLKKFVSARGYQFINTLPK